MSGGSGGGGGGSGPGDGSGNGVTLEELTAEGAEALREKFLAGAESKDEAMGDEEGKCSGRPQTEEEKEYYAAAQKMEAKIKKEHEEWERDAKKIAEKVKRQQDGEESAMLGAEHEDDAFVTSEDITALLDQQMRQNAKSGIDSSRARGAATKEIGKWFLERAKYVPLRLSYEERKHLRLVDAVMRTSEYTHAVDGKAHKSEARRTHAQIKGVTAILTGMITAINMKAGQGLVETRDFRKYGTSIKNLFEIARRYKIMNPEKLRGSYGKMLYMLQDAITPGVREHLEFSAMRPVKTVYELLERKDALRVLQDPHVCTATAEILPAGKSRAQIRREIKLKENAKRYLSQKYSTYKISADDIELCLNSICDNNNFLNANRKPIDRMIAYLHKYFSPANVDAEHTLAIKQKTQKRVGSTAPVVPRREAALA